MPVFGRDAAHPYDAALAELLQSNKPANRAMARNIMHDHRVSEAREAIFDRIGGSPRTAAEMERAIRKYSNTRVRTRKLPDYVFTGINGNNIITGKAGVLHNVHPDAKLARLLDLNGLWPVFWWAKREKRWGKTFAGLRDPWDTIHNYETVSKWLDENLVAASDNNIEEFVSVVFDVLNQHRRREAYQPSWATAWAAVKSIERYGPERWLEVVGMTRPSARWIVLLTYSFAEAGTVVRPTQLDADWYPHHFPSPPLPVSKGGHPMDLQVSPRAVRLLPEFIHRQIDHHLLHFRNIGRTNGPTRGKLVSQRKTHHDLLTVFYGPTVKDWMDNPI